ncbi:MAG TPA: hypothetical protein VL992_15090 [Tepidisphaeraceae bacterium]|nr:hypothetical protein [Tepidisphaeraceae bacterium]
MKKKSKWSAYFGPDGSVNFDAMPEDVKLAFIAEGERSRGRPLTRAQRREFEAWRKRSVGRPRVGEGFQRWNVSLERGFARKLAAYAKAHGMTRSRALAEGAKLLLSHVA